MHLLLTSNGTIALMSRKSFLDLTRQGQHKRLKKLLQTAEDADVSFGCSASSSTPAILYEDAASPPEENSLDFLAPLQSDSLDIFYDALNEPPIESNDNYDYVLPAESLSSSLRNWALKYCITHVALTALLCILNEHRISDLPLDARTVLRTPKTVEVIRVGSGIYSHLGIEKGIRSLHKTITDVIDEIRLFVNMDVLPLFSSSSQAFWPILAKCSNINQLKSIRWNLFWCGQTHQLYPISICL
ncbi:hypothetical protein JTE90_025019 [Oedothorax gibbosus]|uniref:Uncharacterized protein n=1 Tax=Oedothorax gibbosus TaxID=931172 RepID=A0AAV6TN94_9ARAC|nr:hypothetical protein JTE90_025019 [Oedothorax gibbosus]